MPRPIFVLHTTTVAASWTPTWSLAAMHFTTKMFSRAPGWGSPTLLPTLSLHAPLHAPLISQLDPHQQP